MNCIRLICREGDAGSLTIKSTIAQSILLPNKTDENLDFDDQDIVIIRNERSDPTKIRLAQFDSRGGPSRHANLTSNRHEKRSGRVHLKGTSAEEYLDWILEGGESVIIKASGWRAPHGAGRSGAPE